MLKSVQKSNPPVASPIPDDLLPEGSKGGVSQHVLNIEKLVSGGKGLGRLESQVVLVKGGLPGETVLVNIREKRRGVLEGEVLEILRRSTDRVTPLCPVFGQCGGCQFQNMTYESQLLQKWAMFRDAASRIGKISLPDIQQVIPSPHPFGYRSTIRFVIFKEQGRFNLGFYKERSHQAIQAIDCLLMPVAMQRLTAMVANRLGEHRTLPLFLESLEIRQSVTSGKALLIFRGPYQPGHQAKVFLEGFLRISDVAGCLFEPFACKGKGKGIPKNSRVVEGQDYLTNSYRDLTLQIGARSFMQPNWPVFESIGRVLLEWIGDLQGGQRVLELYAGIGALGLSLARQGALTTLVETNPFALADGRSSASMNHVRSCRFKGMSAEKFLASSKPNEYDVLVVDPPRIGLSPLVIQEMGRVQSPRLYYLSCDAPTLARDLAQLCSFGYQVTRIQPFDMFPQTAHIETLVELVMGNA